MPEAKSILYIIKEKGNGRLDILRTQSFKRKIKIWLVYPLLAFSPLSTSPPGTQWNGN